MQGGASLAFFKAWCGDAVKLIVMTGYHSAQRDVRVGGGKLIVHFKNE